MKYNVLEMLMKGYIPCPVHEPELFQDWKDCRLIPQDYVVPPHACENKGEQDV
jgi:hypothetical protein